MTFKIGFAADRSVGKTDDSAYTQVPVATVPRKSVVQVKFPGRGASLAYYNDQFDLHPGDWVYVDGKLEGQRGRVTDVNYNFKIKVSDYKRIIAVVGKHYDSEYERSGYFAAVAKGTLFAFAIDGKEAGSFTL